MKQIINGVAYHYEWLAPFIKKQPTLVCLHGFTGTGETFRFLGATNPEETTNQQTTSSFPYNYLVIDIIGHGRSDVYVHPYRYQFNQVIHDLIQLLDALDLQRISLLGYSMGARLALGLANTIPKRIDHLILESGSPGLKTEQERLARQKSDQRLASRLMNNPMSDFVDFWQNIPLFHTQISLANEVKQNIRNERLSQSKYGLACSLQYMGTGRQPSYWGSLTQLTAPSIHLLVGELDNKFVTIAQEMQAIQPNLTIINFENAGHCIHLEQPFLFKKAINQLLQEVSDEN